MKNMYTSIHRSRSVQNTKLNSTGLFSVAFYLLSLILNFQKLASKISESILSDVCLIESIFNWNNLYGMNFTEINDRIWKKQ